MVWRKGRPRKLPDPRKRKFADLVGAGVGKVTAMKESGVEVPNAGFGRGSPTIQADRLLRDPEVVEELVRRLRSYARGWVEIEELSRGILTNQMLGISGDGQRDLEMSDGDLSALQQRAALGALAILSRHAPEALAGRAKAEDVARSFEEMARSIVGAAPKLIEGTVVEPEPLPSLAPTPSDEDIH